MSKQIGRIATFTLLLFGVLFVNLNLIALVQADDLTAHPANRRLLIREYEIERGPIVVGEEAIARSVRTEGDLQYLREYPAGALYGHLTGYYSFIIGRSGLEAALNEDLIGQPTEVLAQNLGGLLFADDQAGNTVELTILPEAQQAAADALEGRVGAVVALDPRTGAVLASYANPTFDPGPLSTHDAAGIREAWEPLRDAPERPLVNRAIAETYPPGSTFKLLTAAAALENGLSPETAFPDEGTYDVPQTGSDIGNFGGGLCADGDTISLADAMRVSCNTVFARLGVELGEDELIEIAERFGFNRQPPFELRVARSAIPKSMDVPSTAQSAIGQRDVRATPMQMAIVAASMANGGELVAPHLVRSVRDPSGRLLREASPRTWDEGRFDSQVVNGAIASQLRDMMIEVVENGTGTRAQIEGVTVGGKTGTAQTGGAPTVWFVGFADDEVAVAVVLPEAGDDATGGQIAAPIARAVMQAALGR
ncbi:peptidoglycan D,D-transpeptidase FtsI family protein [Egicoccus sp. AB-alg6-2]|uniref:peptidoglycan D,D-transpeptidase FtsI family protein n=1 Tax=Egicoccus sp. AB-alg6-2 TaxID=3242692 RepID=UPI00359E78E9